MHWSVMNEGKNIGPSPTQVAWKALLYGESLPLVLIPQLSSSLLEAINVIGLLCFTHTHTHTSLLNVLCLAFAFFI